MSSYSAKQDSIDISRMNYPSLMTKFLVKDKKYNYNDGNKENHNLQEHVNKDQSNNILSTKLKIKKDNHRYLLAKIEKSSLRNKCHLEELPINIDAYHELKTLKDELRKYMARMGGQQGGKGGEYQ